MRPRMNGAPRVGGPPATRGGGSSGGHPPSYTHGMSRFFPLNKSPRDLTRDDVLNLKTITEGWYCEYKRELSKPAAIAKSVSAFANTYGGWIFYGIEEDRSTRCARCAPGILNTDVAQAEVRLRQAVSGAINPAPYYEHFVVSGPIAELDLDAEHAVIAVFVPQGTNAPYLHSSGRIYRRVADESDPREETDRHFLAMLFERSKGQRKNVRSAISKQPERSESEQDIPCLRILIFTDVWNENAEGEIRFSRFKEIMGGGSPSFDNFYTTTYGHIARLTFGNQPSKLIYSWHHRGWFEEIVLPFSWFFMPESGFPYPRFADFEVGKGFLARCRSSGLTSLRVLEISGLLTTVCSICMKLETLLDEWKFSTNLHFKIQLSGIWRCIPFVDVPSYLTFVEENGVPVSQEDVVYGPPGSDVESLIKLKAWRREGTGASDDSDDLRQITAIENGLDIYREIHRCLGIPADAVGFNIISDEVIAERVRELISASSRATNIAFRHLGLI